jgi:hypothetical protein
MSLRISLAILILIPAGARSEPADQETIKFIQSLQNADGGFLPAPQDPKLDQAPRSSLRATSSAIRALKYFGGELPKTDHVMKYVASCFDEKTGSFSDVPQGKPDYFITAVGVMAVVELKMDEEKYVPKSIQFLTTAKEFEEVRLAAAGMEAAQRFVPATVSAWLKQMADMRNDDGSYGKPKGDVRMTGSVVALILRVNGKLNDAEKRESLKLILAGQQIDGGFAKADAKGSDLETSYRVMRAIMMLKEKPKDVAKLKEFIAKCRNKDGGYGVAPGQPSNIAGTYFAGIIYYWLK